MTRVIQIRGTSGSGKTTVMRAVMSALGVGEAVYVPGRKKPLCYGFPGEVYVLGHYEATCGGCDNIGSAPKVYAATAEVVGKYSARVVLQEGLLLSEDTRWTRQMAADGYDVRALFLTTPLETCLKQVEGRRQAAGNDAPLDPTNTANRVEVIERARVKLEGSGIIVRRAHPSQAAALVLKWVREASGCR